MPAPRKYPDELRERAVRLVFESGRPIAQVARDLGVHKEALRHWVRQAEADAGERKDRLTTGERERLKELERENVVFFAFVLDVYSRMIVGWQFASHMRTELVSDALQMAVGSRRPDPDQLLIHYSDRGSSTPVPTSPTRWTRMACWPRSGRSVMRMTLS